MPDMGKHLIGNCPVTISKLLKGKTISFDIDGVNAYTAPLAVKLYNKRYGDNKKFSDLKDFNIITDWINEKINDKKKAAVQALEIWNDHKVLSRCKPVSGALKLSKLIAENYSDVKIHYITSRPSTCTNVTIEWFSRWFPWVDKKQIHISDKSEGVQSDFKIKIIKSLAVDHHFEDSWEHSCKITSSCHSTSVVLVNQPWNSGFVKNAVERIIVAKKVAGKPKLITAYEALLNHLNSNVAQY
jgi:uncharacterized HAD superfamily protein